MTSFPERIPSPDPLDPMEGTCSHGKREECDKCDAERSAEDCDHMMFERDELDLCLAECREIVGATSEDVRNDLRLLVEERDMLRSKLVSAQVAGLRVLLDAMLAGHTTSSQRSRTYAILSTERSYWQGCADAEASWISEIRKRIEDAIARGVAKTSPDVAKPVAKEGL